MIQTTNASTTKSNEFIHVYMAHSICLRCSVYAAFIYLFILAWLNCFMASGGYDACVGMHVHTYNRNGRNTIVKQKKRETKQNET